MKKGIHPKWHKKAKVVVNGQVVMHVGSTLEELNVEIWSGNHPFYTGQETLVDTDNLVEKFKEKQQKAQSLAQKVRSKKQKRAMRTRKTVNTTGQVTLKDMLKSVSQ
ncbi:MAG: 50S ribosomal protein L31 [Candidatus Dojkabacteria bacterium]|nr:MAG: 50S ribosomal protein L31 [Candidatus Dojkabacteria bacterium]